MRPFTLRKLLLAIELCLVFFFSLRPATDPDYGWHIANGRHVLDGSTLSGRDLYSWTADGLWVAHEWLAELVMSLVHAAAGPTGNSILAAAIVTIAYALVAMALIERKMDWASILVTLPICFAGALRAVSVRPLVLEIVFFSSFIFLTELFLHNRLGRWQFRAITVGGAVLWANTHGSFPLMTAVAGITAVELFLAADQRWRTMIEAAVLSMAAFIVNPWTLRIYGFAVQSLTSGTTLANVEEWKRPVLSEWIAAPLLLQLGIAALGLAISLRIAVSSRGTGFSERRSMTFVGTLRGLTFAFLALQSGRHVVLLGIAAAPLIARGVSAVLRGSRRSSLEPTSDARFDSAAGSGKEVVNALALASIIVCILVVGWGVISPAAQATAMDRKYPTALLRTLESISTPEDRLFNEYRWGGYLIANSRIPVFIDGRSELYGDAQLDRYASIIRLKPGWEQRLDSLGVTRVLMPVSAPLSIELSRRGWKTAARDSVGWLLTRKL
ncbi:MAG TPA: hypothetical protein VKO87_07320 [Gemmatimonadaceae bacterium]|nr:hypothetical protein [Gemmatimonadaceae bacterium]